MYLLSKDLIFPPVHLAEENGLLALGGDLTSERLMLAYRQGIFPWFSEGEPILWYSPDPRMVLFPNKLRISKSMKQLMRKQKFHITFNQHTSDIIAHCKNIERKDQAGTWITNEMQEAYLNLHRKGFVKSVEVWEGNDLVGGLYGIDLGTIFCGESMFSKVSNASKIAFIYLAQHLEKQNYVLIDCQIYNDHLASLGAEEIPRARFLEYL
jgi:leucyl/phenylalanyl-tRNA--protein transferase